VFWDVRAILETPRCFSKPRPGACRGRDGTARWRRRTPIVKDYADGIRTGPEATVPFDLEVSFMRTRAVTVPLLLAAIGSVGATVAQGATGSTKSYTVKMSGSVEVPKADGGGGTATITVKKATKQLCWSFRVTGVTGPTAAHIHAGGAGVAGPVVIPLGGKYKPTGCTTAAPALLAKIVATPKKYYVNIHSKKYVGGAVRSQL